MCLISDLLVNLLLVVVEFCPACCHRDHIGVFLGAYRASLSITGRLSSTTVLMPPRLEGCIEICSFPSICPKNFNFVTDAPSVSYGHIIFIMLPFEEEGVYCFANVGL